MIKEELSTSTQLFLVKQQVESLEHYLDWVIGGVTLTITVLIALFLALQFLSIRGIVKRDLKKLEDDTRGEMDKYKKELSKISKDLQKQASVSSSEHGRAMSFTCAKNGDYSNAFFWKIYEAFWYHIGKLAEYNNYVPTLLLEAIELLNKVPDNKFYVKDMDFLYNTLNFLKKVSTKEADKISKILSIKVTK